MIPGKRSTVSGIVRPNLGRSSLPPAPPVALGCRHRCIVEDWKNVEAEMGCKARKARNAVMEPSGSWFLDIRYTQFGLEPQTLQCTRKKHEVGLHK